MFKEMRRKKQVLSKEKTEDVLNRGTSGVLALMGENQYPYAVPLSYIYDSEAGKIYFHSAAAGFKIESIKKYDKASFCVIDKDTIIPEEYTTFFRSAIAFGQIRIIEDDAEKREALTKLATKYSPNMEEGVNKEIDELFNRVAMIELSIDHLSGKEAIELVNGDPR